MDFKDPESFQRLYRRVGRAAILKAARLVGRFDVAEEIVQSAFLKLWDASPSFPDERAAYAWIYRTCHNAGIDHLRAHATRFESGVTDEQLSSHSVVDARMANTVERHTLIERLGTLTDREAQVLAYRLLDDMTQQEIAEVMGVSRKTVVRLCAEVDAKLAAEPPAPAAKERC